MRFFCIAALLMAVLSACGFQLRGSTTLPVGINNIYIDAESSGHIMRGLERSLQQNKITVVTDNTRADLVIRISEENKHRRVSSIGVDGKSNDYRLEHTLVMEVLTSSDKTTSRSLLAAEKLLVHRDYRFDPSAVLGSNQQEQILYTEMRQQLISLIMLRLRAVELN